MRAQVALLYTDAQYTKHPTSKLAHYFAWCPKYWKKILLRKLAKWVEWEIRRVCEVT